MKNPFKILRKTKVVQDRPIHSSWSSAVASCLTTNPGFFRAIHPHNDLPVDQLGYLAALWVDALHGRENATSDAFLNLFQCGDRYQADAPTRLIQAVSESEGKPKFDIYRLAETIRFTDPTDSFGPLTPRKTVSLCKSIRHWSGAFEADGTIRLVHQEWDNVYIVRNGGAARRIAIWLRLQGYSDSLERPPKTVASLSADVTPVTVNKHSLDLLGRHGRLIIFQHDSAVEASFATLSGFDHRFSYTAAKDGITPIAFATLPHFSGIEPRMFEDLLSLHLWADSFFDPRRYLLERMTTYRN